MTDPDTIAADYTLRPSELAATLALLVEARQPTILWGGPGTAKSAIARQIAAEASRQYVDVRALLLDPVDLRGIPWRDGSDRTRWAPPAFLPPSDDPGLWLINLEELPSAPPMVQAALYQLVLDRKVGEYELPEGASLIACGNRESDRGVVHRMPTPLASRFVHLEIKVDAEDWLAWAAGNGIAPEVMFFVSMRPELLHQFDPNSREAAFPCPRTWEFTSGIVQRRGGRGCRRPRAEGRMMAGRVLGESAQRISGCVTALLREQPFFGSLALRLPIRADASRETVASDGREIRYAPRWIAETDAHVIETAIARVVLACALKHHTRRNERVPERWQRASQFVTHALLRDAGFTLPPNAEAWEGMSVEQAYDRLADEQDDGDGQDRNPPPAGGGPGAAAPAPQPDSGDNDGSGDSGDLPGDDDGQGQTGPGQDDGSGAPPSFDPSGTGEVMDAPAAGGDGASANPDEAPPDITAEEQTWDEAMHQALSLAKAEGKAPSGIEETVRSAHASAVDWRALLRRHMLDAAKSDYSWSLPNRRFIDSGLYLPSIRSEGIDAIAVIIDTSGSIRADILAAFWAEIREVATEIQPERVVVLQVDAALQDAAEYAAGDPPDEIVVKGRGGTDFRPGSAWLDEQAIQPGVCLYLTDMECSSYPDAEPGFPVVFCNWGDPPGDWNREPWGERIDIAPEEPQP